jgi:hypothetical protein
MLNGEQATMEMQLVYENDVTLSIFYDIDDTEDTKDKLAAGVTSEYTTTNKKKQKSS